MLSPGTKNGKTSMNFFWWEGLKRQKLHFKTIVFIPGMEESHWRSYKNAHTEMNAFVFGVPVLTRNMQFMPIKIIQSLSCTNGRLYTTALGKQKNNKWKNIQCSGKTSYPFTELAATRSLKCKKRCLFRIILKLQPPKKLDGANLWKIISYFTMWCTVL